MQETQVQSLGREDPLEKQMATHSSTLAWRIPWTKEFGGLQSMGVSIKNLPAVQETQYQSLGQEDALEKGMATHSSVLARRIPGTGEPGGLPSMGSHRVGRD